ncbi:hypothetical protein [Fluviicola taffensis]|uniref:IrrE N-terminal-like domain-containing protein n=1 Tax=Fluviicola taffensis (strain DSM 16823 / NCIMB 13979 / RW262) TaxID=755732 RepID=F2ID21_FLUTR|nr:hypothetical protein [Fluviicola taffensis]AEA44415.1 hypothetical protein Fluta_2430 [Fluviicola taffensis DSM 16823]
MEREKIICFIQEIGIQVVETELPDDCFLPGLAIEKNTILLDSERLKFPGDLLHEAGHLAVTEAELRPLIGTNEMDPEWPSDGDELAAILWSYAALKHLGLEPEVVFHPDGYKNESEWLIQQFQNGNYIGLPLFKWMGFCSSSEKGTEKPYPHMLKWLR